MIRMRREDGILELRFHTDDGPLHWSLIPHAQLEQAFLDVSRDRENEVVIPIDKEEIDKEIDAMVAVQ